MGSHDGGEREEERGRNLMWLGRKKRRRGGEKKGEEEEEERARGGRRMIGRDKKYCDRLHFLSTDVKENDEGKTFKKNEINFFDLHQGGVEKACLRQS